MVVLNPFISNANQDTICLLCCLILVLPLPDRKINRQLIQFAFTGNYYCKMPFRVRNKQLKEVSGSRCCSSIKNSLIVSATTSLVPAVNAEPGVRMEERSPGSYRINIRGSTLRSPFGVRNVKVYWNDIPFTDAGGNTYLNQLSFFNTQSIEIIKGPAGSVYGAGTGGAILLSSQPSDWQQGASVNYTGGSYQCEIRLMRGIQAGGGRDRQECSFNYTHQTSDGYRLSLNAMRQGYRYLGNTS